MQHLHCLVAGLADIGGSAAPSGPVNSTGVADQISTVGTLVPLVTAVAVGASCHYNSYYSKIELVILR